MGTVEALRGQLCVGNRVGVLSLLARSSLLPSMRFSLFFKELCSLVDQDFK